MAPSASNSAATLSSLVTSATIGLAPILPAAAFNRSLPREAITTSAPSFLASSAVARPIPEGPPTTTTVCPETNIACPRFTPVRRLHMLNRSSRLVLNADARLATAKPRQLPDPGTGRIHVGGDIDVDQIRLIGVDRFANRVANVAGAIDPHAFDAAGPRHRSKIRIVALTRQRIVEVGRKLAPLKVTALQPADRGIGIVVPDHPNHGQIVFDRRTE